MAARNEVHAPLRTLAAIDELLRVRLEPPPRADAAARRSGVEHEYAVFEGDRQLDFTQYVHRLGLDGRVLHPTNPHMYMTRSGLAVMADGIVAETASPPARLRPGFASALEAWAASGRATLEAHLPRGLRLEPGSTHISVETHVAHHDQLCLWYAQTFAPALMLLMDNTQSPGSLVRPRPQRFEFGGEFVDGPRLRVAVLLATGAVLALEQAKRMPPAVDVSLEPARQRFGWYIDRRAFGADLYSEGRATVLRRANGATITAQQQLETCWDIAREALDSLATKDDIALVERVLHGDIPLPCEQPDWQDKTAIDPLPRLGGGLPGAGPKETQRRRALPSELPTPYAHLTHTRGNTHIEATTATWDFVAFRISRGDTHRVISIPESQLATFVALTQRGALDDLFDAALIAPNTRALTTFDQTSQPGVYGTITRGDALLPRDRVGVGNGQASTVRPGKIVLPPPLTDPERKRKRTWWWIGAAALLVSLAFGSKFVIGDPGHKATPTPTAVATQPQQTPPPTARAVAPPTVGPIRAVLTVPVTTYTVQASSPAGLVLFYRWSLVADPGQECGTKNPATNAAAAVNRATWSHDSAPPDRCAHLTTDHPFTITVEVSDGVNPPIRRTYRGTETGTGSP